MKPSLLFSIAILFVAPVSHSQIVRTIPLDLPPGSIPLEMVLIEPGEFIMGTSPDAVGFRFGEDPPHPVRITKSFYIGRFEITQEQWETVMGSNPSEILYGPNHPVDSVSWYDCQAFVEQINQMGFGTFRLPTEAEWEYACRSGTATRYSFGDALECPGSSGQEEGYCETFDRYMWYLGNDTYNGNRSGSKPVGQKLPNPWGLYDMHGNLWEWVEDFYAPYPRPAERRIDPVVTEDTGNAVFRGGSFFFFSENCRSAARNYRNPAIQAPNIGLRLVREVSASGYDGWELYK